MTGSEYYLVDLQRDGTCCMIARGADWRGFDWRQLNQVVSIDSWPADVVAGVSFVIGDGFQERLTDFIGLPSIAVPAVSARARNIIESLAPQAAQFLPLRVFHRQRGADLGTYWVVNVIETVSGLNFERTKWIGNPSALEGPTASRNILRPALVADIVRGHHLFRLDVNGSPFRLFASEELRQALIVGRAADGFGFEPVVVI